MRMSWQQHVAPLVCASADCFPSSSIPHRWTPILRAGEDTEGPPEPRGGAATSKGGRRDCWGPGGRSRVDSQVGSLAGNRFPPSLTPPPRI